MEWVERFRVSKEIKSKLIWFYGEKEIEIGGEKEANGDER